MDKNEILKRANDYISAEKDEKCKKRRFQRTRRQVLPDFRVRNWRLKRNHGRRNKPNEHS